MSDDRFRRMEELYQAALERPAVERTAFLRAACGNDEADLLAEVLDLVGRRTRVEERFLKTPLVVVDPDADADDVGASPTYVDEYRIIELIDQGGMGIVYLAEQTSPSRRVALKVMRWGLGGEEVAARFETERQALAIMDHPGVARIFDAGTTEDGRPYFVMEYVDGLPIVEFVHEHRLPLRARLALFEKVCAAVQHAHQKGVVHRDLTPRNVLVTIRDGAPQPKVIDFGIAKAIEQPLTATPFVTRMPIGTLEYMSPEQARGEPDIDVRSDIYSLGVLLYQLITGELPFRANEAERHRLAMAEVQRMICEDDFDTPSTRLISQIEHDTRRVTSFAETLGTSSRDLVRQVRGELDWIVMRALAKERDRRYASADDFGRQLRKLMDGEAVDVAPPDVWYRVGKFVRRHRAGVASSAAFVVLLIAAAVLSSVLAIQASTARDEADTRAAEARWEAYVGAMAAAGGAVRLDDVATARRVLDLAPPEHRGWEWDHFALRADDSDAVVPGLGMARALAVSPDEALVAAGIYGGRVSVRHAATLDEAWALDLEPPANAFVMALAFDAGSTLLGVGWGGGVVLRRAADGAAAGTLDLPAAAEGEPARRPLDMSAIDLDSARDRAAAGDHRGNVHRWSLADRAHTWTASVHRGQVRAVALDGAHVVSIGADGVIATLDAATGTVLDRRDGTGGIACRAAAFVRAGAGSDGTLIALLADAERHHVHRVRMDDGTAPAALEGATAEIYGVSASRDGAWIAVAGADKSIRLWRPDDPRQPVTLRGHDRTTYAAAFVSDGQVVSTAREGSLRAWRLDRRRGAEVLQRRPHPVVSVAWAAPDAAGTQRAAAVTAGSSTLTLLAPSSAPGAAAVDLDADATSVAFDPTGAVAAVARIDGGIDLRAAATGAVTATLRGPARRPVLGLAFSSDGRTLASAVNRLELWDVPAAALRHDIAMPPRLGARQAAFLSHDVVAVAAGGPDLLRFDARTGATLAPFAGAGPRIESVAAWPDGGRVAAGDEEGTMAVWRADGTLLARAGGHSDLVTAIAIAPGGDRIFTASHDGTVRVWNDDLNELAILGRHDSEVFTLALGADGLALLSGGRDGTVRWWSAARR